MAIVKNLLETNIENNSVNENNKTFIEIIRPLNTDIYRKLNIIVLNNNNDLTRIFAKEGHLDCLKYAHDNGFPWDTETCSEAALGGHLDCLEYAHDNGCPWDQTTCYYAAGRGHLHCLEYAHYNGCPWDRSTCSEAARGGHLDCLKYAHDNGCPYDYNSLYREQTQNDKILRYIKMYMNPNNRTS